MSQSLTHRIWLAKSNYYLGNDYYLCLSSLKPEITPKHFDSQGDKPCLAYISVKFLKFIAFITLIPVYTFMHTSMEACAQHSYGGRENLEVSSFFRPWGRGGLRDETQLIGLGSKRQYLLSPLTGPDLASVSLERVAGMPYLFSSALGSRDPCVRNT